MVSVEVFCPGCSKMGIIEVDEEKTIPERHTGMIGLKRLILTSLQRIALFLIKRTLNRYQRSQSGEPYTQEYVPFLSITKIHP